MIRRGVPVLRERVRARVLRRRVQRVSLEYRSFGSVARLGRGRRRALRAAGDVRRVLEAVAARRRRGRGQRREL
eukprot:29496-Pelagococcus_subviridis.AAC.1